MNFYEEPRWGRSSAGERLVRNEEDGGSNPLGSTYEINEQRTSAMKKERIDKILSSTGFWSRKKVREFIKEGRVLVGDEPVLQPSQKIPLSQLRNLRIFLEGFSLQDEFSEEVFKHILNNYVKRGKGEIYLILNKPIGYLSTTELEANYPSFLELLASPLNPKSPKIPQSLLKRVSPAGRLDVDSRGLLLITSDGWLIHRITSPKSNVPKVYEVKVTPDPKEEVINLLMKGVELSSGEVLRARSVSLLGKTLRITLTHGPHRGIRRALRKLGYQVIDLQRIRIGLLELGDLREGEYRLLRDEEVEELLRTLGAKVGGKTGNERPGT